jgi:hypothetical protein
MGIGIYGITRASDVDVADIDVFYNYIPDRSVVNNEMLRLNSEEILSRIFLSEDDENFVSGGDNILEGMYNLRLPAEIFNELGIYTIYIKPKTFLVEIIDCNTLSSLPNIRGLVIDPVSDDLPETLRINNALQGYKVEYLDNENNKIKNLVRYIVSSNKVIPVNENVGNTSQSTTRYRFDDSGGNIFLQVTPSSASNTKPNDLPFIGRPGGIIKLSNTFFSPICIEIEMVENTIETLTNVLFGEQIKDVRNGILTYFDENREIVKQFNLFTLKDEVENVPLYEVKELRENIDTSQNINNILDDVD